MICGGKTTFVDSVKIRQICRKQNVDGKKETDRACIINWVWVFNLQRNIQKLGTSRYSNLFTCLQAEEEVARLKESHDQVGYKK